MRTRLVVGDSDLARTLLAELSNRPGRVLFAGSAEITDVLEDNNIESVSVDPTAPSELEALEADVESVVIAGTAATWNRAVARAVREAVPEAFVLAYTGLEDDREPAVLADLETIADRVLDPRAAFGSYLEDRTGTDGISMRRLRQVLANVDGTLAVVMHDNPDPDAIASAVTLVRIAEWMGQPAEACYYGSINHQQNRAFVNLLDLELTALDAEADLSWFGGFALVDHGRPGVNDGLPEGMDVDIVIDHHPPRGPISAEFIDLRSDVGATSTLLVDYLERLDLEASEQVATALLFGIRVDTDEFTREVSTADFEAGAFLLRNADLGTLERIEDPSMSVDTLETIAEAIHQRTRHGSVLVSGVGELNDRDTLAQAADRLLALEGVHTTLVHGLMDGTIYISARSRGTDLDLGEALRTAFGQIGSAGGHAGMAGAQLDLGVLETEQEDERLAAVVDELVTERFLDALDLYPSQVEGQLFGPHAEGASALTEHDRYRNAAVSRSVGAVDAGGNDDRDGTEETQERPDSDHAEGGT